MNFPDFFRTSIQNDKIASGRFRGLALQCKSVLNFANNNRGNDEDNIFSATGTQCTDRDVPQHGIIKPMLVKYASSAGGTAIVSAKQGVRYYVHGIELVVRQIITDDNTEAYMSATINGSSIYLASLLPVPSVAGTYAISVQPDVLCDVNTSVILSTTTVNFTAIRGIIYYTEIGAS